MTFQTTVKDVESGAPVNCWVAACVQETGKVYARNTDGNGYADLAMMDTPVGSNVTFIIGGGYTIQSPQYGIVTEASQAITMLAVDP